MDVVLKNISFEDLSYLRCSFVGKLSFYESQLQMLSRQIKQTDDSEEKKNLINSLNICRNDISTIRRILDCL